jgi:hypothetical protein
MLASNPKGDGQSRSRVAASPGGIGLPETFKHQRALFFWDARSIILHPYEQLSARSEVANRDLAARWSKPQGIAEQIAE